MELLLNVSMEQFNKQFTYRFEDILMPLSNVVVILALKCFLFCQYNSTNTVFSQKMT